MSKKEVAKTYAIILKRYLSHFQLETIDIAFLIGTKKEVVDGLLTGKKGVVLKTLEKIAQAFNLHYYQFGNPEHPIPTYDDLPDSTKERIAYRKKNGPHQDESYSSSDINEKIILELALYKENDEFLAENILNEVAEKYGAKPSISEIIDRFKKSFKEYIIKTEKKDTSKTGRGPKPSYYRLTKPIPEELVLKAKNALGER